MKKRNQYPTARAEKKATQKAAQKAQKSWDAVKRSDEEWAALPRKKNKKRGN